LPAADQALSDGLVPAGYRLRLSFAHSPSLSFRCWLERHPVSSDICWRQGNWIFRGIGSARGLGAILYTILSVGTEIVLIVVFRLTIPQ
jgi:hypothetical protein